MKSLQKGFTLIELVMVMVIIGILAAIAAPKFVDLSSRANDTADKAHVAGVESALTVLIAKSTNTAQPYPTVTELAAGLKKSTAVAAGVCVATGKRVNTYTDDAATAATTAVGNIVKSVGSAVVTDGSCT